MLAPVGDIISELGTDRNDLLWNRLELPEELPIFLLNPVEHILPIADQIHLVHDDGELAYAQERQEIAMLLGLLLHALQGIDQQQRPFGPGRPGDHVLEKLLMPRRIDDDVVPALPAEERPRRIDGDSLLLLFKKGIEQERILEFFALLPADGLDLFKLAIRQRSRVGIETPQQGGLPVVHMPDDDDVQILRWFRVLIVHVILALSRMLKQASPARPQVMETTGGVPSGVR